jgi:hypothetical protein
MAKVEEAMKAIAELLAAEKHERHTWPHRDEADRLLAKFKEWQAEYRWFPCD